MKLKNKVSIIIPVYNKEKSLRRCIDSVICQTYSNFEVILLDDGSTDNSSRICKEYEASDNRIKYYYQSNSGQTAARNNGLRYAHEDYVMYIDADDYIDANYVEILIKAMLENPDCDLVSSGLYFEYNGFTRCMMDGIEPGWYSDRNVNNVVSRAIYDHVSCSQGIIHSMSGKVFKRNLLIKAFEHIDSSLIICEDGVLVFAYICLIRNFKIIKYAGYHYVQYKESSIHCITDDKINNLNLCKNQYIEVAKKFGIYNQVKYSIAKNVFLTYKVLLGYSMNLSFERRFVISPQLYEKKSRIVIYGAGTLGRRLKKSAEEIENLSVVGWVDKNFQSFDRKLNVVSIDNIFDMKFDYVIVAIENNMIVHDVIELLLDRGIPYKKILHLQIEEGYYEPDIDELQ